MLVPPSEGDWTASQADPTKIRNKKFLTGKSAAAVKKGGADSSWTESESDRKRRIGEEMMGLRPKAGADSQSSNKVNEKNSTEYDEDLERRIKEYNVSSALYLNSCISTYLIADIPGPSTRKIASGAVSRGIG